MADNGFKINKSANFNPQAGTPANPVDGDFFYDSVAQSFAYYHNGMWAYFDSVGLVESEEWLTSAQFTATVVRNSVIKVIDGVTPTHLAGISASFSAKQITVYNAGSDIITVEPEDAMEATSNNRIMTPTGGSMNLVAGEVAVFTYDVVENRWLLVSISSEAGAQVIATTGNPGLVTLHQASLLPLDGVVLSDGDLNTANGVVGLNANKAALITPPTSAVTTLTLEAFAGAASALVLQGGSVSSALQRIYAPGAALAWYDGSSIFVGSLYNEGIYVRTGGKFTLEGTLTPDETDFILDATDVYLGQRKLHFSYDDGAANLFDNYMEYTYLAGTTSRGMKFVNETEDGSCEFWVEATIDGLGEVRQDLILKASTGSDQYISNQQGDLYLNFTKANTVYAGFGNTDSWDFVSNATPVWQIIGAGSSPSGALQAMGADRLIRNVAYPLLGTDVANRNWVQAERQNYIINGAFDFWQRLLTATTSFAFSSGSATHGYTADRWYYYAMGAAQSTVSQIAAPSSEADLGATYILRCQRDNNTVDQRGMIQEIDRRWVKSMRGKSFTARVRARVGVLFTGTFSISFVVDNGGNANQLSGVAPFYTSGVATTVTPTPTPGGSFVDYYLNIPTLPTNITAASLQVNHVPGGSFGGSDYFDISLVQIVEHTGLTGFPFRLAGDSFAGEMTLCERYFERSYALNQGIGELSDANCNSSSMSNTWGGSEYFDGSRFRVEKNFFSAPPTVKFYSLAGAEGYVTIEGAPHLSVAIAATGFNSFYGFTSSTTPGDHVQYHWTADSEIR